MENVKMLEKIFLKNIKLVRKFRDIKKDMKVLSFCH